MNNKRKTYTKPEISFVDFSISANIAANCNVAPTYADEESCIGYIDNGWHIYTSEACEDFNESEPSFCYHVPNSNINVFAS